MKKRSKQQTSYPTKRSAVGSGSRPSVGKSFPPVRRNQTTPCTKCGKLHGGDCRSRNSSCFKSGKTGHFIRDCPMTTVGGSRPQGGGSQQQYPAQARVYSLTPGGVDDDEGFADVVTGTVPLFSSLACTLFDSGATQSFISSTYVKLCGINTQPLEQNINVITPASDVITCKKSVKDCPIIIGKRTLPANLVVFQMLVMNAKYCVFGPLDLH
jgi:hypothetical protein